VLMGRNLREQIQVKSKIPLNSMRVIHREQAALDELKPLESYFSEELNVREVIYDTREEDHLHVTCKANFARLGKRVGKRMKDVAAAIQAMTAEELRGLEEGKSVTAAGELITPDDVEVRRAPRKEGAVLMSSPLVSLELDPKVTRDQQLEGLAREVTRKIQMARKKARLNLSDRIIVELALAKDLLEAAEAHKQRIADETLAKELRFVDKVSGTFVDDGDVDGDVVSVGITVA